MLHFYSDSYGDVAMAQEPWIENDRGHRIFKASRIWESNVWGAMIGGIGAGLVLLVIAIILIFDSAGPAGRIDGFVLAITIIATLLALFPGNLIAVTPVAVELQSGKGLRIVAPLKNLYIPIEEVQEIRDSISAWPFPQGTTVKLNKRHGLLERFVIHWAFGDEGPQLAQAIQRELLVR